MKKFVISLFCSVAMFVGGYQQAYGTIFIKTVPVGDENNHPDPLTGYGAVQDEFRIGKTEVTVMQYCAFLNAVAKHSDPYGLYNSKMGSDTNVASIQQVYDAANKCYVYKVKPNAENFPITYVSWSSAARFCNWLENDQPEGEEGPDTTEEGSYNLDGFMGGDVSVEKNATWVLPTEDQWYKAAYYKGGGTNAGYWLYPTQSDIAPNNEITGSMTNNANVFIAKTIKSRWGRSMTQATYSKNAPPFLTPVDIFSGSPGYYKTYDMGGNVFEWVDADRSGLEQNVQVVRGGAWSKDSGISNLQSIKRNASNDSSSQSSTIGFRVVMLKPHLFLSWVPVGDPGNPPDPITGHGSVKEAFSIGKYPITTEQYCIFLNSVAGDADPYNLYNTWRRDDVINGNIICTPFAGHLYYSVKPGRKKCPINYVTWFDAARFCNWVQNGCRDGNEDDTTTEMGAYTLHGQCSGPIVPVNQGAQYYIPSEDQWYKAAYYNGKGGYYEYPVQSNSAPGNKMNKESYQSNYSAIARTAEEGAQLTPVDLFHDAVSHYGAYDMGGNLWEWNNTTTSFFGITKIQARGGSFKTDVSLLAKENSKFFFSGEGDVGFRIAAPQQENLLR